MFRNFLIALFCLLATPIYSQDSSRAILVLDASGSMWGQIDGTAKITIAQDVIGDLLQTLPEQQQLGLTAYGHRRKGDCTDIETIIEPGGPRADIAKAVNAIKPKGKTPMTDAVIAAANSLRFTEEKATVILVSDGIETCHPDPCAAARALEEAGVDFTAHVVGFNISDPEAIAQMQCLAAETGGTFLTADNADELAEALVTVAAAPEPEPEPVQITFAATLEVNGPEINSGLVWSFANDAAEMSDPGGDITRALLPGEYQVTALRLEDEASVSASFFVEKLNKRVVLVLPKIIHKAEISAVAQSPIGATIDVIWSADKVNKGDLISVASPDQRPIAQATYSYVKGSEPIAVTLPLIPGDYELRYISKARGVAVEILATQMITLTDIVATLEAAGEVGAGAAFEAVWDGPDYKNDFISVAVAGEKDGKYSTYSYTRKGSPATLTAPLESGTYELRYVANGAHDRVLGRRPITVVANTASLKAPDQAFSGNVVKVEWLGPDNQNDYISVAAVDSAANQYSNYAYTRKGSPAGVKMPLDPGIYELRYVANGNPDKVLATRQISIVAAEVSLSAPGEAIAGSNVAIEWLGPDNQNDHISVAAVDSAANQYSNYAYTRKGSPAGVKMPLEPGTYELRYVANGNPDQVLETRVINIVAANVVLDAPQQGVVGSKIDVSYEGPDNQNDYISVAEIGSEANKYTSYTYTSRGNPVSLKLPDLAGTYLIRYVANGNPHKVLARRSVKVVEASAAPAATAILEAADSAPAGQVIEVFWVGPDGDGDAIAVVPLGSTTPSAKVATGNGNPAQIPAPGEPGKYMLHYISGADGVSIGSRPVTVN
ncbi:MAG: VWA domain-containing protein [Marinosulfonomonas sp.]|nr:VWA domain-containing protein [Marinosulfonomonas sp.]